MGTMGGCQPKMVGLVIRLLKQKSLLFVIGSLENQLLWFIVFHCYNQPVTTPVSIGCWPSSTLLEN